MIELNSIQDRDDFFNINCDNCSLSIDCGMKKAIGTNSSVDASDVNTYFGGLIVDSSSVCSKKAVMTPDELTMKQDGIGRFDTRTPQLF